MDGVQPLGRLRRRRLLHFGNPIDARVGEDVQFVDRLGGELADHGAIGAGLEPVERVGADGVLLARVQGDFVEDGEIALAALGRAAGGMRRGRALDVEVDRLLAGVRRLAG